MARIRTIKPTFFRSESVAELPSDGCRLSFIGLWTYVDDEGRGVDLAKLVKADLWPLRDEVTSITVEEHLVAIADRGLICRYTVDGRKYLHVIGWAEHQRINRPTASQLPPCPVHERPTEPDGADTEDSVNPHGADTEDSPPEGNREEGTGKQEQGTEPDSRAPDNERDDIDDPAAAADNGDDHQHIVDAALNLICERRSPDTKDDPAAYRASVIRALRSELADRIATIDWTEPWTAGSLAQNLRPASAAKHEPMYPQDTYTARCSTCNDKPHAYNVDDHGTAIPCPDCCVVAA